MDGGATQLTQSAYNSAGRISKIVTPGDNITPSRTTTLTYATNGVDAIEEMTEHIRAVKRPDGTYDVRLYGERFKSRSIVDLLKKKLAPSARIELSGCDTARPSVPDNFAQALSALFPDTTVGEVMELQWYTSIPSSLPRSVLSRGGLRIKAG